MIIDITEGARMGSITSKKGSPILKVENVKFKREVEERLVEDKMIGIGAPAVRKGKNHLIYDSFAAKHKTYIIENLTNLEKISEVGFTEYCFPLKIQKDDAMPARILVQI